MNLIGIVSIATIISFLLYIFHKKYKNSSDQVPCAPGSLPFIGHNFPILRMSESFIVLFLNFYNYYPKSSMIRFYNFRTPGIIVRDPDLIKKVMLSEFTNFNKNTSTLDPNLDPLLTTNPFFTSGNQWKTNRTILLHGLSARNLKLIALQIRDVSAKFTGYLKSEMSGRDTISVNALELLSRFTAEVVAIAAFGIDGKSFSKEPQTFETMIRPMLQPGSYQEFIHVLTFFFPIFAKLFRIRFMPKSINYYFNYIIENVLASRTQASELSGCFRAEDEGKPLQDFLQKVCEMCRNSETGKVDRHAVTSHSASVFLDGYITSSVTLMFTAYQVAAHPEIQVKLRQEVLQVYDKYQDNITYEAIQEMKYVEQVINESMRLFPALGYLAKVCTKEFKLVGSDGLQCVVHPGTEIVIPVIGLHRDPVFWENPDKFYPDRFGDEKKANRHKFTYLPFGSGPRQCVGMKLAIMQMKAALAALIRDFSIQVDPKTDEPVRVHPLSGLFTGPHCDIWIQIKRHQV